MLDKRADLETDGLRNLIAYEPLVQSGFSVTSALKFIIATFLPPWMWAGPSCPSMAFDPQEQSGWCDMVESQSRRHQK